ncbi:MAG: type II toxin-antitoxin system Phd/YefM family antitoxin [Hyphomonadaceae bacterium]|nr:type II toxin-antitoxin system Phd/YefM family antitoxin [Hyphomonadaceae bacterium]
MKEVGLYDARNSLSALVEEVERTGAEILITRHGKPVARLAPAKKPLTQAERERLFEEMFARRDARTEPDEPFDWKGAIREGREE